MEDYLNLRFKLSENEQDIPFSVLDSYFSKYPLSVSHLNSFNIFCSITLPKIFKDYQLKLQKNPTRADPCPKTWIVRFHNVMVHPPSTYETSNAKLYPRDAMENNLTYSGIIRADVGVYQEVSVLGLEPQLERIETLNKLQIGKLPILVRSQKCSLFGMSEDELTKCGEEPYENGGYFIVSSAVKSGKERPRLRVVIGQERSVFNHVVIFQTKKTTALIAELRSQNQNELWSLTQVSMSLHTSTTDGSWISVNVQAIADLDNKKERGCRNTVYLTNILLALGLTQSEIYRCVSIADAAKFLCVPPEYVVTDCQSAKIQIASYLTSIPENQRLERLETILSTRLIHTFSDSREKALQLGYMAVRLICVKKGLHNSDDRDDYTLKRIDTAGTEMAYLVRKSLREMAAKTPSHYKSQRKSTVEDTIRTQFGPQLTMMLATGIRSDNWRGNNARGTSKGDVVNDLETHNWIAREACKRRISTSHDPKSPMLRARQIMPWYSGFICPAETPESEKCLTLDSEILTPNGLVPIGKLNNGDEVITIDPITFKSQTTTIANYFTKRSPVVIVRILGGFTITGTKDHPLLCSNSSYWTDIGNLKVNNNVTIKYSNPLTVDADDIWARILGFSFADAGVYKSKTTFSWAASFGSMQDAEEFMTDLELLGFSSVTIKERVTEMTSSDGRKIKQRTFRVQKSGDFCRKLIDLGAPIGRKTSQPLIVPEWVMNGTSSIQREFVAGFQGGDGGSVAWSKVKGRKAYHFTFGDTSIHSKFPTEAKQFMVNIKKIMVKFGVTPRHIKVSNAKYNTQSPESRQFATRVVGTDLKHILLPMSDTAESIIAYMDHIGYRYCNTKTERSAKSWFYMKYKREMWNARKDLKIRIVKEHSNGDTPQILARKYKLTKRQVHSMLEQKDSKTLPPRNILSMIRFLNKYWLGENCCKLPITSITNSVSEVKVADFTTVSNNHSFVANGFVTHNCGLIKNMALSAQVTVPYNAAVVSRFVDGIMTPSGKKAAMVPTVENIPLCAEWAMAKLIADGCLPLNRSKRVAMSMRVNQDYKLHPFQRNDEIGGWYRVFINGIWKWITKYPNLIIKKIKSERKCWDNVSATIVWLRQEVHIYSDGGRLVRPMFSMKNGDIRNNCTTLSKYNQLSPKLRWEKLKCDKVVEMIDMCECTNSYVCMGLRYLKNELPYDRKLFTLCEIHPALILGVPAQTTPSPERVQGPRVSYQASMAKQAIGWPSYAYFLNDLKDIIYMWYPRPRLVKSRILDRYIHEREYPTGTDVIMALMPYGSNMEDSFILNKGTVERGGLRVTVVESYADNTYSPDEKQGYTCEKPQEEDFEGGSIFRLGLSTQYNMIESDGTAAVGSMASPNSKLVSKIVTNRSTGTRTDSSVDIKSNGLRAENARNYSVNENGRSVNVWEQTGQFTSTVKSVKIASRGTHRSVNITTALSMQVRKGDKAACYTDDHEILTVNGWIPFSSLTLKHKVASWDLQQPKLVYTLPLAIQAFKHNGKIIDIKGDGLDLRVTNNHSLLIRYKPDDEWQKVQAHTLLKQAVIPNLHKSLVYYQKGCPLPQDFLNFEQVYIPKKYSKFYSTTHPLAWFSFVGTFLGGGKRILINDIDYYSIPFGVLTDLYNDFSHFRFTITPSGLIDDPSMLTVLRELYNWRSTYTLPDWILDLSGNYAGILVNAITTSAVNIGSYAEVVKWSNILQQLMLHSSYYWDVPSLIENDSDLPRYPGKSTDVLIDHNISMKTSDYTGNVYCCTVPSGIIYVRRNGVGVWCGNSTCAQKGTCGKVVPQADLPWNPKTGMSPDIIMNTHAIPSRMTIGQILAMLIGKAIALEGENIDLTPFDHVDEKNISSILKKWGFKPNGNERLRSGITGEWYDAEIFMAPCYEQILHHWAAFKVHARKQGTLTNVTRQPVEGRAMGGGGRFGEMEKDCLVSNGVPHALVDRTSKCSDAYTTYGCKRCGRMTAIVNHVELGYYKCNGCQSPEHVVRFEVPYAFKLLAQYVEGMGMTFRLIYNEK